jgi:hypothetical protein
VDSHHNKAGKEIPTIRQVQIFGIQERPKEIKVLSSPRIHTSQVSTWMKKGSQGEESLISRDPTLKQDKYSLISFLRATKTSSPIRAILQSRNRIQIQIIQWHTSGLRAKFMMSDKKLSPIQLT